MMKGSIQEKWQKIYGTSTKTDLLQEVISEVVKQQARTSDREVESTINQIITGQVALNHNILRPKLTIRNQTNVIFATKKKKQYSTTFSQRELLEIEIERNLARNDIKITVINLKVLTGNLDDTNRLIKNELRSAFGNFLRSTGRLIKSLIYLLVLGSI